MLNNKLDISKWKEAYPFLGTVWNRYNEFDNSMDYDRDKHKYEGFCTPLMNKLGYVNEEHKKFCLKLVRNLGRYSDDFKFQYFTSEYCTNLNNWVYDSKKKYNIPDNIIDNCFQDYIDYMTQIGAQPKCSYYSYDDIYEPINIIMLKIFESNVNVLISTLNQENNIFIPSCQNYVCELVKIYNYMNSILCAKGKEGDEKKEKTCDILKNFYDIYKWFFFVKLHNTNKIPSLDNIEAEYLDKCVPNERKQPLTPVDSETTYTVSSLSSDEYANPRKSPSQVPVNDENQGSSMSRTVSTAFGTVAGASSILALLYKFTPGRRWIHYGFGRQSGRINNDLYAEGPNELLFQGFESDVMSSNNARYNLGYGST